MLLYDVMADKIVCLSNQSGLKPDWTAGILACMSVASTRKGQFKVLNVFDAAEATALQAGMPAVQSIPDTRPIRDLAHIYRVRDDPRNLIEGHAAVRFSEPISVNFDPVNAGLLDREFRRVRVLLL